MTCVTSTAAPYAGTEDEIDAPGATPSPPEQPSSTGQCDRPALYLCFFVLACCCGLAGIWYGNKQFAPEMYDRSGPVAMAKAFAQGKNFATFDLNINIREMRDEQLARFKSTPDVAVLGASHWQEAHPELLPQANMYNAHVHRDYYEDMPGVVEMLVRHNRLPKKLIIAIRDRLFTPVADRTDFLWLPGIPYYERMAPKLGLTPHPYWKTAPVQRWRELISTSMLYSNVLRWYKAPVKPHATFEDHHKTLDTLRPGGSIYWSSDHAELFTPERSERLSREFSEENYAHPPKVDPIGVKTIDRLLAYLKNKGVDVYLVHPPFNPIYYNRIVGGPYHRGLERIKRITRELANKYDYKVFGSFNPAEIGCTADMYIDAEHANPECLGKLFKKFAHIAGLEAGGVETRKELHVAGATRKALDVREVRLEEADRKSSDGGNSTGPSYAEIAEAEATDPIGRADPSPVSQSASEERPLHFAAASFFWHEPNSLFVSSAQLKQKAKPDRAATKSAIISNTRPVRHSKIGQRSRVPLPVVNPWRDRDPRIAQRSFSDERPSKTEVAELVPLPDFNPRRKNELLTANKLLNDNSWLVHRISTESKHITIFFGSQEYAFGLEQKQ